MTTLSELLNSLQEVANTALQEDYDNSGLITGDQNSPVTGVLVSFDVNEAVLDEAIRNNCNVVVAHHPALFRPIKQITTDSLTGRLLIKAIGHQIALVAMHTNIDNHPQGVNRALADKLGLRELKILSPLIGKLRKLVTFVPHQNADDVRDAMHDAGAGCVGHYDSCSFNSEGIGTFRAGTDANPFVGSPGSLHYEPEVRIEVVYPQWIEPSVVAALKRAHPYEEVAYDLFQLQNSISSFGAGMIGRLDKPLTEESFLLLVKDVLGSPFLKHTKFNKRMIQNVALCGGAGSFLIQKAAGAGADAFLTGDVKYHDFFDAPESLMVVDAGHYETEQFIVQLLAHHLTEKFPNFAVLISDVNTNPVNCF